MADLAQLIKGPPRESPPDLDFESKVNAFISTKWNDLKAAYWVYHSWIWEALLMYAGNLYLKWNGDRKGYDIDVPSDPDTPRPKINRFAPAIDAIASNFQVIPDIEALPSPKDSIENLEIAEICNVLSEWFIKDCALRSDLGTDEDKVGIAGQWLTLGGCFFINTYVEDENTGQREVTAEQPMAGMHCRTCDTYGTVTPEEATASGGVCPQCGQPMDASETTAMMPQMDENGEPMMEPMTEKRVRCRIESPLGAYPRPTSKTMKDSGFFMFAERWSLDRIWSELGIEDASEDAEYPDGWNTTAENSLNFFYLGYSNYSLGAKDAALVIWLYCEPGKIKEFPDGVYAIYINGKCKRCEPWSFGDEHPLTKVDFKALPTLFFPRSVAFDLTGVTREFLDYSSLIKLHGMTNAASTWVCQDTDNHSEITGYGDKVVTWSYRGPGSTRPVREEGGSLDNGVYEMRKLLLEDIEYIAQIVSVWRGEAPEGVKSGKGLNALRVQASAMFAGPTKNFGNGWKEAVRKGVKLYQKHYTLEQLTRIVGDNRLTELQKFKSCNLDTCVEWKAAQSEMPRTREEQRAEMIELFDRGMLDVNDASVREKAFELFGDTGMLGTFNKDATRARYENSTIKEGGEPIFMPEIDDNMIHHQIHSDQVKSMDFLGWPPESQQKLIQHDLVHQAAIVQKQQIAASMSQPMSQPGPRPGQSARPSRAAQPAAPPPQPGGLPQ